MRQSPILGIVFVAFACACLALVLAFTGWHLVKPPLNSAKPDFAGFEDASERKQAFFAFMAPMLQDQNQRILKVRTRLQDIEQEFANTGTLSRRSQHYLKVLERDYLLAEEQLDTDILINRLLRRVDVIPVPLALAQAASESGWGTSRFAQTANNYFGQWCYVKGCGIVPGKRLAGAVHEVADFDSVRDSVTAYFFNLNTYYAYQDFRAQRQRIRDNGKRPRTNDLIPTLLNYSERREAYLEDLRQIISVNKLTRFALNEQS